MSVLLLYIYNVFHLKVQAISPANWTNRPSYLKESSVCWNILQSVRGKLYKKYISCFSWLWDGFFISFPEGSAPASRDETCEKNLGGIKRTNVYRPRSELIAVIQSVLCRARIIRISVFYGVLLLPSSTSRDSGIISHIRVVCNNMYIFSIALCIFEILFYWQEKVNVSAFTW